MAAISVRCVVTRIDVKTGQPNLFVSGYTNREQPNIWDRSAEVRAAS